MLVCVGVSVSERKRECERDVEGREKRKEEVTAREN